MVAAAQYVPLAFGGHSFMGLGRAPGFNTVGTAGTAYGTGGSGSTTSTAGAGAKAGAAGASGVVIVTEYY
jgi:hypothetical protein